MASSSYDCLIAGAGPAGTAAGILLAQAGLSVLIVEKRPFPRFHIGESLIPAVNHMLQRLGVWDQMDEAGFLRKYGAEFCYGKGETYVHNIFAQGLIPGYEYTYQVERSRFDALLLHRAREVGCEIRQPTVVNQLAQTDSGWRATLDNGESVESPWLLDATGRSGLLPRHLGLKSDGFDLPRRFAVFNHFRGVKRRAGRDGGNIIVVRVPTGWFWSIPLDEERTSVGLVTTSNEDRQRPRAIFEANVVGNPFMRNWMLEADPIDEFHVEADYSYCNQQFAGSNWMLLGDAAGFIDPVFSSGVYLAIQSAGLAEKLLTGKARQRGFLTPQEQRAYDRSLRGSMDVMYKLVRLFYDRQGFSVFMQPTDKFQLFSAVNSIVAGHTARNFSVRWRFALFRAICRLNRHIEISPTVQL